MNSPQEIASISTKHSRNLTNQQRQTIYEMLLKQSKDGVLSKGSLTSLATMFSVSPKTIGRIWKQAKLCMENGLIVNVSSKLTGNVGRKKILIDPRKVSEIPLRRRTNIRSIAKALNMSKSTVHRRVKEGFIRAHSNAVKPDLTDENKKTRLEFCLSKLDLTNAGINTIPFDGMFNQVHIDEKWFFMTRESERYYLLPEEDEPVRTCKSKRFITKVMFLAAVARPRFDESGNVKFSGKIGIFPFVHKEPAKRKSKNRIAGTMETKPMLVTKDVTRAYMIEKILPAIKSKWPDKMETVYIQQDNAKPHINPKDVEGHQHLYGVEDHLE
ncbi:Transposase, Tc1-like protein [Corchorus olitorius]|uniref:Transposase, Tc1-like protein n=1 Tax=Corchorus olitorius TaxID=93759 RepID=A0A1R3HQ96_9ROSI|nr:Transposase, Tc1-like protein [Corchorus olitorius]